MRQARIAGVCSIATVVIASMALAACSSGGGGGGGGSSSGDTTGPITYVAGKDNNGSFRAIIDKWNTAHPDQKVTFKEQSDKADQQHDDLVQHFKARDAGYDVVSVDVVWTAEFAAQQWLEPLEGNYKLDTSALVEPAVKAATYAGKLYAGPTATDGGMLYYRSDLVKTPPKTWAELTAACSIAKANNMACYAGQFAKYEGLTVNASEAINSAGGEVVKADGTTPNVDTPEAKAGLQFLVNSYKNGTIPKEAITYQEEQGRIAFEQGKLLFLRNWPYVYSLATTDGSSKVKGKFGVAPLPGPNGIGASTLGGHNMGISVYSKHKKTGLEFIKFVESPEIQKFQLEKASNAPIIASVYDDPTLQAKFPYLKTLKESVLAAKSRPVTPFYPAVTAAIEENAYAAIKGEKSVDQAVKDMQAAIASAAK
jgi:multiple sugar transport system substrate-binding protein